MLVRIHRYPTVPVASLLDVVPNFDRLSNEFGGTSRTAPVRQYPALDVVESDKEFVVVAELPGVAKEDVKVSLHDGKLTISGERKPAALPGHSSSLRTESAKGQFTRSISFPKPVQADAISAELKDGILKIALPKVDEVRPREISIR